MRPPGEQDDNDVPFASVETSVARLMARVAFLTSGHVATI
jgi:hypothetical protein